MNWNFLLVLRAAVATCVLGLMTVAPSLADYAAPNFEVINGGQHVIDNLYVSPHASGNWGDDLLGKYDLAPNQFVKPLATYTLPSCNQDVRVIYHDRTVDYFYGLNVCQLNVTFHY